MVKVLADNSVTPLANESRNSDSITEAERDARYRHLASADNISLEAAPTQVRGQASGMNPISNKPIR